MLNEAFYRAGLPLYVAYYRRRLDRFIAAKQIVQRFLGQITSVNCMLARSDHLSSNVSGAPEWKQLGWRVNATESGGGLFLDLGCHTLDILDFLVGPLSGVQGDAVTHSASHPDTQVETHVSAIFRTHSGAVGEESCARPQFCCVCLTARDGASAQALPSGTSAQPSTRTA